MWATGAAVARVSGLTVAGVLELADALPGDGDSVASSGGATLVGMLVALGIRGRLRSTPRMTVRSADSHGIPTPPHLVCDAGRPSR
jgi:hypothetical protein